MPSFNIVTFPGDHCGPEVVNEGIKILRAIEEAKPEIKFNLNEQLLGGVSWGWIFRRSLDELNWVGDLQEPS